MEEREEIFSLRLSRYDRDAISIEGEKERKKEDSSGVVERATSAILIR